MKIKLLYILGFSISIQLAYCEDRNMGDLLNNLMQNKISKIDYNTIITEISKKIELKDNEIKDVFVIDEVYPYFPAQSLVENLGPALSKLTPLLRLNILLKNNKAFLKDSILALAMVNDISSINQIKSFLYSSDWYIQYVSFKSAIILSALNGKELTALLEYSENQWFAPIKFAGNYAIGFIRQNKILTYWDIYHLNKQVDNAFLNKFNSCNFDNRHIVDDIKTDLKIKSNAVGKQIDEIIEKIGLSKKHVRKLQNNLINHHFFLQYKTRLIGVSKEGVLVDVNTKVYNPIFVFNLSSRTYVILRGDHQIENDIISELIYSNNEYKLEPRFTLIYKVESIMNSAKEGIKIAGQNWFLNFDKKSAIIRDGVVCGDKVKLELGI